MEIEGEIGNASSVKEEDTVVIVVDVENIGNADADDVRVEIFYYPKKSPTTQEEIDDMENQMELEKADGGGEDEGGMQWNEFKPDEKQPDLKVISG